MLLKPGSHLGHFEILGPLGAGGMGEVYRAQDTKLERHVAIKVLPASFAAEPDRLSRLGREARMLAALNHANIGGLYDFQEFEETHFLVMELIAGESLEDRLLRGPLPLDEALPIFAQVARALEAAHERGIVHRDLKPGNIMVGADGETKVLDFGLAKAFGKDADESGEDSSVEAGRQNLTAEGIAVGTPTYMSPEQARAKDVDKRTDIWALGCTLYESLTGRPPFKGNTPADLIAHILRDTPELDALPAHTPESVRNLIRRCLERDRRNRLKDAGDIALTLEDAQTALVSGSFERPSGTGAGPAPPTSNSNNSQRVAAISAVIALLCAGILVWVLRGKPSSPLPPPEKKTTVVPTPKQVRRFSIGLSAQYPLKRPNPIIGDSVITISPDGQTLVYVAEFNNTTQLIARRIDRLEARPIAGTEGAWSPFFSPDGKWLGYQERGNEKPKLMKIPIEGGVAEPLADTPLPMGASWGEDDSIVFGRNLMLGLGRVPADGGPTEDATTLDRTLGEITHGYPQLLRGGKLLIHGVAALPLHCDRTRIFAVSLETGERRQIARDVGKGMYVPSGHFVYPRAGAFFAIPFDLDRLTTTGRETRVTESRMATASSVPRNYCFSEDGTLVYVPVASEAESARTLVWVDREGNEEQISAPARPYLTVRLSPDDSQAVFDHVDFSDVWIYDVNRGTTQRLTFDPTSDYRPIWTPDGSRVVFLSSRAQETAIYSKRADGVGAVEHLVTHPEYPYPNAMTPDGKTLIFTPVASVAPVYFADVEGGRPAEVLFGGDFNERDVRISPDGRWISYESSETGRFEIYVQSFPELGAKWQVSLTGGENAVWRADGKEMFYWEGDWLMAVTVETEPTFSAGDPKALFEMDSHLAYDAASDGQRFIVIKEGASPAWASELIVVQNWFEELKRLVPVGSANETSAQSEEIND